MKILFGLLICFCSISFAQIFPGTTQGFMFMDNGAVFTVRSFFSTDGSDPLVQPYNAFYTGKELEAKGSNYYIDEFGTLVTFDQYGNATETLDYLFKDKVKAQGGTYFLTKGFELNIVKTDGTVAIADTSEVQKLRKVKAFGGLFMVTKKDELIVVNPYHATVSDMSALFNHSLGDIKHIAHNYMIMEDGTLYTIGFKKVSDENFIPVVKSSRSKASRRARKIGGNFFFDSQNNIHTIDNEGNLNLGDEAREEKVIISSIEVDRSSQKPKVIGNNYFVYSDGAVFTVDVFGSFYYLRTLDLNERIAHTNFIVEEE